MRKPRLRAPLIAESRFKARSFPTAHVRLHPGAAWMGSLGGDSSAPTCPLPEPPLLPEPNSCREEWPPAKLQGEYVPRAADSSHHNAQRFIKALAARIPSVHLEGLPARGPAVSGFLCRNVGTLLAPYKYSGSGAGSTTGHTSACVPLTVGWKIGL